MSLRHLEFLFLCDLFAHQAVNFDARSLLENAESPNPKLGRKKKLMEKDFNSNTWSLTEYFTSLTIYP